MKIRAVLISRDDNGYIKCTNQEIEQDDLDDMYRLIECNAFDCVASISGKINLWVDDEGLMKPNYYTNCTDLLTDSDEAQYSDDVILAGNILVTGVDYRTGETVSAPDHVTPEFCASKVHRY